MQLDNLELCEDWLQLCDGAKLLLKADGEAEFEALDAVTLAHHLATTNRWGGAARVPYSVAQHSLLVGDICRFFGAGARLYALALLHDAHEPFMGGDKPTPMKRWERKQAGASADLYTADRLDDAVRTAFGLAPPSIAESQAVKHADLIALAAEARDLMAPARDNWTQRLPSPAAVAKIEPIGWEWAKARYARALQGALDAANG